MAAARGRHLGNNWSASSTACLPWRSIAANGFISGGPAF